MMIDIYVVNAFSKNGSGGNAAGVAITDATLTEQQKTNIAFKLGYSETVFVSGSQKADFKLEYFTPEGEVPLCGHATIATFIILNQLNLIKKPNNTIETKEAVLNVSLDPNGMVFMEQNLPVYFNLLNKSDLDNCFSPLEINSKLPIQMLWTGLKDILLPISSVAGLESMNPNFPQISALSKKLDCVGVHAFALTNSGDVTAICRNFAPLYGIDEEAATGTSNCALACYLFQYGIRQSEYIFEQGYNLNSVSKIYVRIENNHDEITKVSVGGTGYLVEKISVELKPF